MTRATRRPARARSTRPSSARPLGDSVRKLDPRLDGQNPVMFVVEVGAVLTSVLFLPDLGDASARAEHVQRPGRGFPLVHRAVRQLRRGHGRGSGQGPGRLAAQDPAGDGRPPPATGRRDRGGPVHVLDIGDEVEVVAGEVIPGDGDVVEGIASVDESAITGESAPVIRESGGDRSAVTGGTKVLSDRIVVRISARPGEIVSGPDDRARRRRRPGRRPRTRSPCRSCCQGSRSSSCSPS